jgi:hypothetical protein
MIGNQNADEIVSWVKENHPRIYNDFIRYPEQYYSVFKEVTVHLKKHGRYYMRTSDANWKSAMIEKIRTWGREQPLSDEAIVAESSTQQTQTNTDMSKYADIPVATPTLVFGTDVSDLKPAACIATIKANNAQIKELTDTGIESPYITAQIAGLNAANAALVTQLDTFAA